MEFGVNFDRMEHFICDKCVEGVIRGEYGLTHVEENKMESIIKKLYNTYKKEGLECPEQHFIKAADIEKDMLINLLGNEQNEFMDFYLNFQPSDLPRLACNCTFLDIKAMVEENTDFEPGCYLRKCGIYTFALTIGGNAVCIDTNSGNIYICDHGLVMQDFDTDDIVINSGLVPCDVYNSFDVSGEIPFSYENIIICMDKIEDSFITFIENIADGKYMDLEKFITY